MQNLGESDEPGLVGNAEQRVFDRIHGWLAQCVERAGVRREAVAAT
jgi:hypothetical protein